MKPQPGPGVSNSSWQLQTALEVIEGDDLLSEHTSEHTSVTGVKANTRFELQELWCFLKNGQVQSYSALAFILHLSAWPLLCPGSIFLVKVCEFTVVMRVSARFVVLTFLMQDAGQGMGLYSLKATEGTLLSAMHAWMHAMQQALIELAHLHYEGIVHKVYLQCV